MKILVYISSREGKSYIPRSAVSKLPDIADSIFWPAVISMSTSSLSIFVAMMGAASGSSPSSLSLN